MKSKGHFCYGCDEFFHDSNPNVSTHSNCKKNPSLGICVDAKEFEEESVDFNKINIDDLTDAFEDFIDAKNDYKMKAKNCEYDRGYFLSRESDRIDEAKNKLKETLDTYIKQVK